MIGLLVLSQLAAQAGDWPWTKGKAKPEQLNTLEQVARSVDAIEEKILDDGTVVLKQPDVYSQSRMTLYRRNFEQQLFGAINQFNTVVSARLYRSDQAAFTSQTSLAAAAGQAMAKRGSAGGSSSSSSSSTPTLISPGSGPGIVPNGLAPGSISRPDALTPFGPNPFSQGFAQPNTAYGLGVEPTVYLDQLKRYQDALNEIRRVNMGDDIADSAGYGLYLIRMPVSIQPGECTRQGHGAVLTSTVRHDFGPNFLYQTYRNLVINDLVDQLTPIVYELVLNQYPKNLANLNTSTDLLIRYRLTKQSKEHQLDTMLWKDNSVLADHLNKEIDTFKISSGDMSPDDSERAKKIKTEIDDSHGEQMNSPANQPLQTIGGLEITRINERDYPIPPSEFDNIFFTQNLYALALAAREGIHTVRPKSSDVRTFIRRELETAYDILTQLYADNDPNQQVIIDQFEQSVETIASDIRNLEYDNLKEDYRNLARVLPGKFRYTDDPLAADAPAIQYLKDNLIDCASLQKANPNYFKNVDPNYSLVQELTILMYSIAVESGLLNNQLRLDMKRVFTKTGLDASMIDSTRFFAARPTPEAEQMFQDYVKKRWRMITFALDPVVDQQNIADASSVKRDLQLALAFAFSTGQINLNQLTQFQRRIETDAETIALNRTVTSFAHGDDTFGFRFLPRYQNPPQERSNFAVIGNQLLRGGPGRNYQLKNSKLESGQRELSVVVIMPSFLQGIEMDVTGNWFPLHDPDQMKIHTPRMIEQGRQVVELRGSLACIQDQNCYRPGDVQRLATRVHQLELMLPMQTYDVAIPFESTLGGFQLFQQGSTALVPSLDSFEGVDAITKGQPADVILYGRHFSIQETNVIVGGVYLNPPNLDGGNLGQAAPAPAPAPSNTPPATPGTTAPTPTTPPAATASTGPTTDPGVTLASYQAGATSPKAATTPAATTKAATPPAPTPAPAAPPAPSAPPANTATVGLGTMMVTAVPRTPTTVPSQPTVNNTAIDVISREVIRISIPGSVTPTLVLDAAGKPQKFVEVSVATPTGISNRLLIPYVDPADTPPPAPPSPTPQAVAFDLNSKDSSELDISYQWMESGPTEHHLVATRDPGSIDKAGLKISWDSPVGLAPKTLQANFTTTVNNQTIAFSLPANSGAKDDYAVDRRQMTLILLKSLEAASPYPATPPASLTMNVTVQPWIPRDTMGYRVQTGPKPLKTPLTVKLNAVITGVDALHGVPIEAYPASEGKNTRIENGNGADPAVSARIRGDIDRALQRASATSSPPRPITPVAAPVAPRTRPAPSRATLPPLPTPPASRAVAPSMEKVEVRDDAARKPGWKPPWRKDDR
jgi:hypothetical protein